MSARAQTADLLARLQRHYIRPGEPMPGGVFIPECGVNGGVQSRADALYVGFTSTSGRLLVGHELKVSRADWRKELDQVGKADWWADNCHCWYIVAPGPEVVPAEELPHGWGLMYPNPRTKTRMQVVVRAQVHANRRPSWDAMRSIMARLDTLRAQHEHGVRDRAVQAARQEAENRETEARLRGEQDALTPDQQMRLRYLERIEEMFGEKFETGWGQEGLRPDHVAAALRLVRAGAAVHQNPRHAASQLEHAANELLEGLAVWTDAMSGLSEVIGRNQ